MNVIRSIFSHYLLIGEKYFSLNITFAVLPQCLGTPHPISLYNLNAVFMFMNLGLKWCIFTNILQETNRLEYLIPKKTSLRHRLPMGDQGFIDFVAYLLEVNPKKRPSAAEALKHPWLSYPYEPISAWVLWRFAWWDLQQLLASLQLSYWMGKELYFLLTGIYVIHLKWSPRSFPPSTCLQNAFKGVFGYIYFPSPYHSIWRM